jgi:hypothetical protein
VSEGEQDEEDDGGAVPELAAEPWSRCDSVEGVDGLKAKDDWSEFVG